MWLMLQQDEPDDYVIATGETHSVRELVELAFAHVGLDPDDYVHIDSSLERGKAELHDLVGDPSKARERLGWEPTVSFEELVEPARRRRPRAPRVLDPDRGAAS